MRVSTATYESNGNTPGLGSSGVVGGGIAGAAVVGPRVKYLLGAPQAPPLVRPVVAGPVSPSKSDLPGGPSGALHVRKYVSADWFTTDGVFRKRREIEAKGLPDFNRWRFITLTLDPEKFGHDPLRAFLEVRPRLRYFMTKAKKAGLWSSSARWCWKLEFQANGWPHWHLLVERKQIMSVVELQTLTDVWGFGRTNVEMVRGSDFVYSFKYAFKPVQVLGDDASADYDSDETPLGAPAWFLDYYAGPVQIGPDDWTAPKSMQGVRFWQTSKGFYTGVVPDAAPSSESSSSRVPRPVRSVVAACHQRAQVFARTREGRYIASAVITLAVCYSQISNLAAWHWSGGGAAIMQPLSYVVPAYVVEQRTNNKIDTWRLRKLSDKNRLTVKTARRMVAAGKTLHRC